MIYRIPTTIITFLFAYCAITANAHELSADWKTACSLGLRKSQVIKSNLTSITTEHFHWDKDCQNESFRFQTTGSLSFPNEKATWIDFAFESIELTVFVPAVIEDFNTRAACGFTNWQAGVPQTITGLKCAIFNSNKETQIAKKNDMKFGIFKIHNDKLYFGQLTQERDGSSPEKRPVVYSPEHYEKSGEVKE